MKFKKNVFNLMLKNYKISKKLKKKKKTYLI